MKSTNVKTKRPPEAPTQKATGKQKKHSASHYLIWGGFILGLIIIAGLLYGYYHYTRYRALAEYRGGKVTRDEFIKALHLQIGTYDPIIWKVEDQSLRLKKKILNEIIEEHLLLAEAGKLGISATESELKTELDSFKSGYTEETFRKMLDLKGISYKDWAEKKQKKYLIQKLIKKEVVDKIKVDPEEIKNYYKNHAEEFSHPEQVRARHIMVSSWEEAQKIAGELAAGGNFAALAKKKSISPERWKDGDLGYFSRGTHPQVFDRVCFNTPVGETSQVIKSEYGYHIFKVLDKRGPVKEDLEEATGYIINELRKQKSKEAFEKWYKPIYDAAGVKINDDLLKRIEVKINEEDEKF